MAVAMVVAMAVATTIDIKSKCVPQIAENLTKSQPRANTDDLDRQTYIQYVICVLA